MVLTRRRAHFIGDTADPHLSREYSEATQQYIDEEIARTMEERYSVVMDLLIEKKAELESIAQRLLEVETLAAEEFYRMAGADSRKEAKEA